MIEVKISSKPTEKNCRCGNWFQHYKNFSFRQITGCVVAGCSKVDIVGTHIVKLDPTDLTTVGLVLHSKPIDSTIYILPLCKEHSESKETLNILPSTKFVIADIKKTCGEGFMTYVDSPVL
ncbi:MAG: hypothetical protein WCL14_07805 [Bacteroidota bacterium]